MAGSPATLSESRKHAILSAAASLDQPFSRALLADELGIKASGRALSGIAATLSKLAKTGEIERLGPDSYHVVGMQSEYAEYEVQSAPLPLQANPLQVETPPARLWHPGFHAWFSPDTGVWTRPNGERWRWTGFQWEHA